MFESITLKNNTIKPALFLAPMTGITHSAFRRLVSHFGGYGALFTEMLSGPALLHENLSTSPFTKKRDCEGKVFYQLLLSGKEDIQAILDRISTTSPFAIDLNLGCPAPNIKKRTAGAALFNDNERLNRTLNTLRKNWDGIFTVKCRLGHESKNWKQDFKEKLTLFENNGIDAIIVHPRFSEDKLKRRARWEHFSWIAEHTTLPIIGNGDILSPDQLKDNKELFSPLSGLMLGRITAVKPWIFKDFYNALCSDTSEPTHVNYPKYRIILSRSGQTILNMPCHLTHYYTDVWETFYKYTLEDFPPEKAIGRIKEFSTYYARNFFFGHELYSAVQGAKSLEEIFKSAMAFLDNNPKVSGSVSVAGI